MTVVKRARAGLLLALPLAVVLSVVNPPSVTEAAWQRGQFSAGSFGTVTIPAPTLNGQCTYDPGFLGVGAFVRILWKPPAGYTVASAELQASTSGLGSALAPLTGYNLAGNTTGNATSGYITEVQTNLLGGLIGLGTELQIAIVIKDLGWTSKSASVASNAGLVGGLGGNCRNLPAA
ncbi:hypothetical protein [Arthrobacter sp. YN]|uniref:hypothetical protein n=1 Tax=Arthrobacter sp. YN TaxID=2020486 RepID=UPI000B5F9249|nr:hypothetical protein [Arthrobacter sp. YN]ASN18781.1 hypothetical protein CGK93_02975 [Arthrobacter sp. YN]